MKTVDILPGFRCVDFKHQAQERIYERVKDLTPEEEIEFFRKCVEEGPFAAQWRELNREHEPGCPTSTRR